MSKIKCLIVDDEPLAIDILENYIGQLDFLELSGYCKNAIETINFLQRNHIDLIFLDIEMPNLSGIDLLKNLKSNAQVIFTTAYREYAINGYELNIIDYFLKPFSFERFFGGIQKVITCNNHISSSPAIPVIYPNPEPFIYLKSTRKMVKVNLRDILFIEGLKDYVKIRTLIKDIISYQTLNFLEEKLPDSSFIRIHKCFIVNMNHINSFTAQEVEIDGKDLPIGRLYKNETLKLLKPYQL